MSGLKSMHCRDWGICPTPRSSSARQAVWSSFSGEPRSRPLPETAGETCLVSWQDGQSRCERRSFKSSLWHLWGLERMMIFCQMFEVVVAMMLPWCWVYLTSQLIPKFQYTHNTCEPSQQYGKMKSTARRKQRQEETRTWRKSEGRRSEMEKVRREKMQVREKVGKSRNTVFFQCLVAPEGRKVGSLKRQVRR